VYKRTALELVNGLGVASRVLILFRGMLVEILGLFGYFAFIWMWECCGEKVGFLCFRDDFAGLGVL